MGWRDRSYNRTGSSGFATDNPLSSPEALFNWSVPGGVYGRVRVRLHFWLLLVLLLQFLNIMHAGAGILAALLLVAATLSALVLHELGHMIFAKMAAGSHEEFVIGPFGNMLPPSHAPGPWPMFIAQTGGMLMNFAAATACFFGLVITTHSTTIPTFLNPVSAIMNMPEGGAFLSGNLALGFLYSFYMMNLTLMYLNLLPFFWLDGGYILQAVLAPATGAYQAVNITCWAGMLLAGAMISWSVMNIQDHVGIFTILLWALLFYSSLVMLRQLRADAPGLLAQLQPNLDRARQHNIKQRLRPGAWGKKVKKRLEEERREQDDTDRILAKVSQYGLASLTWMEKRHLKSATQRQQERERQGKR